jgi:hypothetical protein
LRSAKLDGRLHTKEDETSFVLQRFASARVKTGLLSKSRLLKADDKDAIQKIDTGAGIQ